MIFHYINTFNASQFFSLRKNNLPNKSYIIPKNTYKDISFGQNQSYKQKRSLFFYVGSRNEYLQSSFIFGGIVCRFVYFLEIAREKTNSATRFRRLRDRHFDRFDCRGYDGRNRRTLVSFRNSYGCFLLARSADRLFGTQRSSYETHAQRQTDRRNLRGQYLVRKPQKKQARR